MTYESFRYVFYGGALLAGLMLILSVVLFFVYRIPTVIGDLTGANARKAIEAIRNQNETSGNKLYKSSKVNRERGKLTDKISPSGSLMNQNQDYLTGGAMGTEKISTQELPTEYDNETTVLDLDNETTVLNVYAGETTVLNEEISGATFIIEYEITFIHTNESIEVGVIE